MDKIAETEELSDDAQRVSGKRANCSSMVRREKLEHKDVLLQVRKLSEAAIKQEQHEIVALNTRFANKIVIWEMPK